MSRIVSRPPPEPGLDMMVSAANEVAKTARVLLAAMLTVAITMAATMIAATDEALFRDAAKVFPSLGVEIRLSTAYALAPPLFLFLHVNALLQLHLLAKRLTALEAALPRRPAERERWRGLVHGIAFAQILTSEHADRPHRFLLNFISYISVTALPAVLLLTAQTSFVRYQSDAITHVHQMTLFLDLCALFWFHVEVWRFRGFARWKLGLRRGLTIVVFSALEVFSLTQAIPPGPEVERLNNPIDTLLCGTEGFHWTCRHLDLSGLTLINTEAKPDLLAPFGGGDDAQAKARRQMIALAKPDRSFRFGNFLNAQLFAADLRSANLSGANLINANLSGAILRGAILSGAELSNANLSGADLISANLNLSRAELGGTNLDGAKLTGADLSGADLSGAKLSGSNLWTANLSGADLSGADLSGAYLGEANLSSTNLSNANLSGAYLWMANLNGSDLREADLSSTRGELGSCLALVMTEGKKDHNAGLGKKEPARDAKDTTPSASCDGSPLAAGRKLPSFRLYADVIRDLACANAAARSLVGRLGPNVNPDLNTLHRAALDRLAEPAGADCPGLRGMSDAIADARSLFPALKDGAK